MKTELEIAKENVTDIRVLEDGDFDGQSPLKRMSDFQELKKQSSTHKATCQRISGKVTNDILFLEQCIHFEEKVQKEGNRKTINITKLRMKLTEKQEELTDLKNTIKLYSENGI